jgi:hypothetical protein
MLHLRRSFAHLATGLLALAAFSSAHAGDLKLWYLKPAQDAMDEALPIGNGRIGGVVFGRVDVDRIQLNEDSLWTGNDHDYGAYQTLGDLFIGSGVGVEPDVDCPSGQHASNPSEEIGSSIDNDSSTKWCVDMQGKPVVWQAAAVPGAEPGNTYTLTSANDVPERDPRSWEFAGSMDGQTWTVLDKQTDQSPFERRGQAKSFSSYPAIPSGSRPAPTCTPTSARIRGPISTPRGWTGKIGQGVSRQLEEALRLQLGYR